MNCLLHPQTPSAGTCEYCTQPHCARCLQQFLGRTYCPACHARVAGIATGKQTAPLGAATTPALAAAAATKPRPSGPPLPGWLSCLLYVAGFLVLIAATQGGLVSAIQIAGSLQNRPSPGTGSAGLMDASGPGLPLWSTLFGIFGYLTLVLVLAYTGLLARGLERRSLADLGLRWHAGVWRRAAAGLGLATLLFVSIIGTGLGLGWYRFASVSSLPSALLTAVVGLVILLPFAAVEEIALRGYVLRAGTRSWGKWGAVVVSSLAFAVLHSLNPHIREYPLAVVGLVLAGFYLASVAVITGDLWMAIFLHAGWNLMEGPVFGLPVSGMDMPASIARTTVPGADLLTGGNFGPEAGLILCFLMVIHLTALWAVRPLFGDRRSEAPAEPRPAPEPEAYRAIRIG